MKNTKIWFSGEFTCQITKYTDGVVYWQVSAPGMMTRSGHTENEKGGRREINSAKASMLSKRRIDTAGRDVTLARKPVRRTPRESRRNWED